MMIRAAIYARVSTERQQSQQTIDSQLAVLTAWVSQQGYELSPDHIYKDEGASGSRLDRPALDALRDAAQMAAFDVVVVLSPDRLARKYAYQVLILEELRRLGCEVVFLHHPISDNPNDQLLLQIQGAVAEYERSVLAERFRRGKLQRARAGQYLGGKAPYGYRYIKRQENMPGHLVIDEAEAEMVRTLITWLIEEQMTVRQIIKRLNAGVWVPRSGRHQWSASTVHHILSDPIYTGVAYLNRYRYVRPLKPRQHSSRCDENTVRQLRPRDEWIAVPVPPIIDQHRADLAQAQLARNALLSFRHNIKYSYLLRCLLTCGTCGLAMFGRTFKACRNQPERIYYLCHGRDCILTARPQACRRRAIKAAELEDAVWNHIAGLLSDPDRLLAQFQHFAQLTTDGDSNEQMAQQKLRANIERIGREEKRLVDAYQSEVITLEELTERRELLSARRGALLKQQEQQEQLRRQSAQAQEVLTDLKAFCERVRARLDQATFAEKQTILQLLIERIIVGEESLEIRHVIALRGTLAERSGPAASNVPLRSDGVHPTPLLFRLPPNFTRRGPKT